MSFLTGNFLSHNGEVEASTIDTPCNLIYFACSAKDECKEFTKKLVEFYDNWNSMEKTVTVVFVTQDDNEESFQQSFAAMPWLAIPFGDERIQKLKEKCNWEAEFSLPTLCFMDRKQEYIEFNGVKFVEEFGSYAKQEFYNNLRSYNDLK